MTGQSLRLAAVIAAAAIVAPTRGATAAAAQQVDAARGSIVETVKQLKPGEYVWAPQVAPQGPLLLIVNLKTQRAVLFRNGLPIAASTVSTGRPGYSTPTGVFSVLQKHVEHYSSKYDSAPMPYMQRLTWYGIALHAGRLPGYPASHGCIRLPAGFAKLLYGVTTLGMTVAITSHATQPRVAPSPQLVVGGADYPPPTGPIAWDPAKSPSGPVSIVVSIADERAIVLRNGVEIGSGPVRVTGLVSGSWAYALRDVEQGKPQWIRISLSQANGSSEPVPPSEWQRFEAPEEFRRAVAAIVQPGTTVVVTPDSLRAGSVAAPITLIESDQKNAN